MSARVGTRQQKNLDNPSHTWYKTPNFQGWWVEYHDSDSMKGGDKAKRKPK